MISSAIGPIVNGLVDGAAYALIGIGFTLIYGVLRRIHFAHGQVCVGAAFTFVAATERWGLDSVSAALLACVVGGFLGLVVERVVYRPMLRRPAIEALAASIGAAIFLENATLLLHGSEIRVLTRPSEPIAWLESLGLFLTIPQTAILLVAVAAFVLLYVLVAHTRIGRAIRAVGESMEAAERLGVPVERIGALAFVIGSVLGTATVLLIGADTGFYPAMSVELGLRGFTAAVIGSVGSIRGAALAGLAIGLVEHAVSAFVDPAFREVVVYVLLVVVIAIRPRGLLDRLEGR